jgi:hypothetical protein
MLPVLVMSDVIQAVSLVRYADHGQSRDGSHEKSD